MADDEERKERYPTVLGRLNPYIIGSGYGARLTITQIDGSLLKFRQGLVPNEMIEKAKNRNCVYQLWRKEDGQLYAKICIMVGHAEFNQLRQDITPLLDKEAENG